MELIVIARKSCICYYNVGKIVYHANEKFGGKEMRVKVTLACTETGDRNYITKKNNRNNQERIELMKYSPRLRKHTLHRETK